MANNVMVTKDMSKKKITVVREFDAPVEQVWNYWTQSELLDQWWAPKPWKARTKTFDFREGGHWLYAMEGPNGETHWAAIDFKTIDPHKNFTTEDYFTDENGRKNNEMPGMRWNNTFESTGKGTRVTIELFFNSEDDVKRILEMGFEEGFAMALGNLDEELKKH